MLYGLELLVSVWVVSIVLALVVACLFGCFSSPILAVPLYISFRMYPLHKRPQIGDSQAWFLIIVLEWHFLPTSPVTYSLIVTINGTLTWLSFDHFDHWVPNHWVPHSDCYTDEFILVENVCEHSESFDIVSVFSIVQKTRIPMPRCGFVQ